MYCKLCPKCMYRRLHVVGGAGEPLLDVGGAALVGVEHLGHGSDIGGAVVRAGVRRRAWPRQLMHGCPSAVNRRLTTWRNCEFIASRINIYIYIFSHRYQRFKTHGKLSRVSLMMNFLLGYIYIEKENYSHLIISLYISALYIRTPCAH